MKHEFVESEKVELKSKYTDAIARSMVAFLNTEGGQVFLGVDDNGNVIGIPNVDDTLKKLSDLITVQIEPSPQDIIDINLKLIEGKYVIALNVPKGPSGIYCIKKYGYSTTGCLMRIGSTNREMTTTQIRVRYEKTFADNEKMLIVPSKYGDISFRTLKVYYSEKGLHLDDSSFEVNMNLRTDSGRYNLLAELLSDRNDIPLIFVKFRGLDKSSISERNDYGHTCILLAYEKIKNRLISENICTTDTTVRPRKDTYLYDMDCVDEAVINAIVHNDWTQTEPLFSMFEDRIEIFSHGGLPNGLTKELFFEGVSKPRNTTLMRIFMNMEVTEHTGHGIPTIIKKYGKEVFDIGDDYIKCTIPFNSEIIDNKTQIQTTVASNNVEDITKTEKGILGLLVSNNVETADSMAEHLSVTKRTIERALKSLQNKGYIRRVGSKRAGSWLVIK